MVGVWDAGSCGTHYHMRSAHLRVALTQLGTPGITGQGDRARHMRMARDKGNLGSMCILIIIDNGMSVICCIWYAARLMQDIPMPVRRWRPPPRAAPQKAPAALLDRTQLEPAAQPSPRSRIAPAPATSTTPLPVFCIVTITEP